jgi:hypothetical protein
MSVSSPRERELAALRVDLCAGLVAQGTWPSATQRAELDVEALW